MTAIWLDLRHPLDPHLDRLLRDLDDQMRMRGLPYLLTGGMAREILLHYGHGCPHHMDLPGRDLSDLSRAHSVASRSGVPERTPVDMDLHGVFDLGNRGDEETIAARHWQTFDRARCATASRLRPCVAEHHLDPPHR